MKLSIVILAAGQGKRMHSDMPKVLHPLAGKPLIVHVIETAKHLSTEPPIIIEGHRGDVLRHQLADQSVTFVRQEQQLGTGHAVKEALPAIPNDHHVLILSGDVPLISLETLKKLITTTPKDGLGLITAHFKNPTGLGRIVRDKKTHALLKIVEERDADETTRQLTEINTGIYFISKEHLNRFLPKLSDQNAQKEYYLTDIVPMALQASLSIHSIQPEHTEEVMGINDRAQLALLERYCQKQQAEKLMKQGVTLLDPNRFDLRGTLTVGRDVVIDVNVIIEGHVTLGNHCTVGANTILRNAVIGDRVEIKPNTLIDGAEIESDCIIGPFARIRPGTVLTSHAHIGNFVEIKNSLIGNASKINHLSYVGDSEIGKAVNIGAGVITCNYDGVNKHRTLIHDHAFIGSNSALVAPVVIQENATIGAGSVITRDAPSHQLTLSRSEQRSIADWQRPKKKEKES